MTGAAEPLRIGLFQFREQTLVLAGEPASMLLLAEQLAARREVVIGGSVKEGRVNLTLSPTNGKGHMSRLGNTFEWRISAPEAEQAAALLRNLAQSALPAHQYLDPEVNDAGVQITASLGEYVTDMFDRQRAV